MPEMIAATYKGAGPYRNDLAHMLKIESIDGERPNRVMRFVRYDDYTTTGEWASQNKKTIEITERQLVRGPMTCVTAASSSTSSCGYLG
ncbi:hypothetical protein [Rhodococcus sp. LB1]|uniref:hypothetical protein n=1 Tax=Rhodococcus sp. LB1 TaxID=1807499 RepID=UPI000A761373|nr:hypothetical protein [Rhodococcus sp. LB1]